MTKAANYSGRKILVMGLGLHGGGVGVARYLVSRGAEVTVTDLLDARQLQPSIQALAGLPVQFVLGEHRESDFRRADMVVRNPAVPADSPYLQIAKAAGIPIEMEMSFFFAEWPPEKTIGVTGTRGKTTTATFIHHLLTTNGYDAALAGNLRVSAVALLDSLRPSQMVVVELSSWQLEGLAPHQISPGIAVVTNIFPDHLNRYLDMSHYVEAKAAIVRYQTSRDLAVLNRENSHTRSFASATKAQVRWFSSTDDVPGWSEARVAGEHNRANLSAGIGAVSRFEIPESGIDAAVRSFPGVPFRQELVRIVNGVRFINDTTATSPDATVAALKTVPGPLVLIAGGSDKGLIFSGLAERVQLMGDLVRGIVLLPGSGTDVLLRQLASAKLHLAPNIEAAVQVAAGLSQPGDAVLLSPACASFGLFRNEFERGERFNQAVSNL